jgi:hypothetical protein
MGRITHGRVLGVVRVVAKDYGGMAMWSGILKKLNKDVGLSAITVQVVIELSP